MKAKVNKEDYLKVRYLCIYTTNHLDVENMVIASLEEIEGLLDWYRSTTHSSLNGRPCFRVIDRFTNKMVLGFWRNEGLLDRDKGPGLIIEDYKFFYKNDQLIKIKNLEKLDLKKIKDSKLIKIWFGSSLKSLLGSIEKIKKIKKPKTLAKYLLSNSKLEREFAEQRLRELNKEGQHDRSRNSIS